MTPAELKALNVQRLRSLLAGPVDAPQRRLIEIALAEEIRRPHSAYFDSGRPPDAVEGVYRDDEPWPP